MWECILDPIVPYCQCKGSPILSSSCISKKQVVPAGSPQLRWGQGDCYCSNLPVPGVSHIPGARRSQPCPATELALGSTLRGSSSCGCCQEPESVADEAESPQQLWDSQPRLSMVHFCGWEPTADKAPGHREDPATYAH